MLIGCKSKKTTSQMATEDLNAQIQRVAKKPEAAHYSMDSVTTTIHTDTVASTSSFDTSNSAESKVKKDSTVGFIQFDTISYTIGSIEQGEIVSKKFKFKNIGNQTFKIIDVIPDCSCTSPTWTKEPLKPGESGYIIVTYDSKEDIGKFLKSITVLHNSGEGFTFLEMRGFVAPKL